MKNSVVKNMVCSQFKCDHRDVEVTYNGFIIDTYEFEAKGETIDGEKFNKLIFISVKDV